MIRRALVVGASGGIGSALAQHLRSKFDLVTLSRSGTGLDLTDETNVAAAINAQQGKFDLIVVATGALGTPEKSHRAFVATEAMQQFEVNAVGPMLVLKHVTHLIPKDRRAVVAVLSARVGSIGDNALGGWYSYRASKAALNQYVRTYAVEIARSHPQAVVAALHPGTVNTAFTSGYVRDKQSPDVAAKALLTVIDGLGRADSGGFFDYAGKPVAW